MHTLKSSTDKRGVLTLNMHRPEVHNAFDANMIGELTAALLAADRDDSVRIVVITGSGSCFSAGADLNWMRSLVDASLEDNMSDALRLAKLMRSLNYLSKPSIARINGAAFGGGLGLIAACDITVAVDNARFGLTEAHLGLAPAVISPYVMRCIGEANARRYFLSGERFGARKALEIGLIQQLIPADQLDESVELIIKELLTSGPLAVAECKELVFEIAGHNEKSQQAIDEYTAKLIARLRVSAEGQEGLAAFLEKRKPDWCKTRE
ncbi:MAG: enoyl-CoA hydratase/isomerase family protein [Gammaproteobacteria bacterium]|nr:enoyl-CoA hydratase/isomerase family protein [Gammaproteobacteria bacterium]